jgi:hypothetical protein
MNTDVLPGGLVSGRCYSRRNILQAGALALSAIAAMTVHRWH